ncbi:tetratricopeptide repeat protein [Frigidibacter sp. MR17.14]|uniref:tetratricopeptide repeat protein n=1 Tax=Frigidibacter sp. MR17.14 TaxID=3126509 RepID=UPI003012C588
MSSARIPMPSRLAIAAVLSGLLLAPMAQAQDARGVAGPYLAARSASIGSDYRTASTYFSRALMQDPGNQMLLENALVSEVGMGDLAAAVPLAQQLQKAGGANQISNLVQVADFVKAGDYAGVTKQLQVEPGAGPLVDGLLKAWAQLGAGESTAAMASFDAVAKLQGMGPFGLYHKALALASAGDFEGADKILSGKGTDALRLTRRGLVTHAEILSQLDRPQDALALVSAKFGGEPDPTLEDLRRKLAAGDKIPFTAVTSPKDGFAEVFYSVAGALSGQAADSFTLAYARLADALRPEDTDVTLLVAGLLESQGQYDLAAQTFNRVPRTDPSFPIAELGRADTLVAAGRTDAAIEALEQLAKDHSDQAVIWATLGDTLRRDERWQAAIGAYDKSVALFDAPQAGQWPVYYARGICHERLKDFTGSEADMRTALKLSPDQPQVLNYLGYSLLEQTRDLDEALGMIEKAVDARPQDGYIVDSLGWALYRLGRYDEAVPTMEQAVELMSADPVVNDHLGDVYWAVGRKREAEFQWRRALSFKPETDAEANRIREKLTKGLDAVLADEGAKPLHVSQATQAGAPGVKKSD